jgi:hypothetical protein
MAVLAGCGGGEAGTAGLLGEDRGEPIAQRGRGGVRGGEGGFEL